jgi:predicted O-methyltransferase YrrM
MRTIKSQRLARIKGAIIQRAIGLGRQLEARYGTPPRPAVLPEPARRALRLPAAAAARPTESRALAARLRLDDDVAGRPTSREIFFMDGAALPCWQETDLTLYDDWLSAADYYPVYHAVFRKLTAPERPARLLEIGVRTGYMGVAFARAAQGPSLYVGVDPNLYVRNGLELASATFRILRERLPGREFVLIEGFSWDRDVQQSLAFSGPFDIIHIDGDHTLPGKLIDLDLARRIVAPGGVILVDDYAHHSIVADAIGRTWHLGWFEQFAYVPTKRGLAALVARGGA